LVAKKKTTKKTSQSRSRSGSSSGSGSSRSTGQSRSSQSSAGQSKAASASSASKKKTTGGAKKAASKSASSKSTASNSATRKKKQTKSQTTAAGGSKKKTTASKSGQSTASKSTKSKASSGTKSGAGKAGQSSAAQGKRSQSKTAAGQTRQSAQSKSSAAQAARSKNASNTGGKKAGSESRPPAAPVEVEADDQPEPWNQSAAAQAGGPAGNGHSNGEELTEEELKKVKTELTKKDVQELQALLLEKRAEITGDIDTMQAAREAARGGELSHMPLHMADVGSDAYEEEFTLGLMESERRLLQEIDEALLRIERGIYGVCLESGKPINKARLEVAPWAKYCIEVAREREKRNAN
jgi:DnaK suppressor protein